MVPDWKYFTFFMVFIGQIMKLSHLVFSYISIQSMHHFFAQLSLQTGQHHTGICLPFLCTVLENAKHKQARPGIYLDLSNQSAYLSVTI